MKAVAREVPAACVPREGRVERAGAAGRSSRGGNASVAVCAEQPAEPAVQGRETLERRDAGMDDAGCRPHGERAAVEVFERRRELRGGLAADDVIDATRQQHEIGAFVAGGKQQRRKRRRRGAGAAEAGPADLAPAAHQARSKLRDQAVRLRPHADAGDD